MIAILVAGWCLLALAIVTALLAFLGCGVMWKRGDDE